MINKFLNLPRVHNRLISVASDTVVLFVAIWASFALRLEQQLWVPDRGHVMVAAITVVFTIAVFIRLGLYRAVIRFLGDKAFLTIIYGVSASALALIVVGYLLQVPIPRSVPIIFGALAFIFVSGTRLGVRMLVNHPHQRNKEAVAIIGAGETVMMARELSMAWDEVEHTLNRLMRASHEFDCQEILEILKTAPTGFAPNSGVADLVWCNGNQGQVSEPRNADKVRRLPLG